MKIAALIGVTVLYGFLFHGAMRLSLALLGPFEIDIAAPVQWQGIAYTALSALFAAAITTAVWFWHARRVSVAQAWSAGILAIAFIVMNLLLMRGLDGLIAFVSARPLHSLLTYSIVLVAIPLCIQAANSRLLPGTRRERPQL